MKHIILSILICIAIAIAQEIPKEYDTRKLTPNCAAPIRNQGQCGSCWAFCMTTSLSERFCQLSGGKYRPIISPQFVVNCDTSNNGCNGGRMTSAFDFMKRKGAPEDSCVAYYSGTTKKAGPCPKKCDDGSNLPLWYASKGYSIRARDVKAMQTDIIKYGPIVVGFYVYDDFKPFFNATPKGIYTRKSGTSLLGGHGVTVMGWGEENGTPYWLVHNSWGEAWGDEGYFRIKRGNNECGFESMMVCAGLPNTEKVPDYAIPLDRSKMVELNAPVEVKPTPAIMRIANIALNRAKMVNSEIPKVSRISRVRSQVVAGIIYEFEMEFEGERQGTMRVYDKPDGSLEILDFYF